MEQWKRNDPSLRVGDSEEDTIVVSDNEEEVEAPPSSGGSYQAPPLAKRIGPVVTGQQAVCLSPGYREAREQRRQGKLKAEELEPVKGTCAVRKRVSSALVEHFAKSKRQYEQALPFLSSSQECLAARLGSLRRMARRRTEMLEKVPPMAFSVSSQAGVHPPFLFHHPRSEKMEGENEQILTNSFF